MFGALLVAMAAGCPFSFTNDEHCAAQDGDASCAAADASTPYCALDGCELYDEADNKSGCVAELPTDLSCYSPCGGKQDANARSDCGSPDTETDTDPTASTSMSQTDGSMTSSSTLDPTTSETDGCGCEADAPICVDGECVPCQDASACEEAGLPDTCFEGRCVDCVSTLPDADDTVHQDCSSGEPNCVGDVCQPLCQFPEDCPGTGCDISTGLCAPQDAVFYVSPDGNDGNAGTREQPLETMKEARDRLRGEGFPAGFGTIALRSNAIYGQNIVIDNEHVVLRSWVSDPPPENAVTAPVVTGAELTGAEREEIRGVLTLNSGSALFISDVDFDLAGGALPFADVAATCELVVDGSEVLNSPGVIRGGAESVGFRNSLIAGSTEVPFRTEAFTDFVIVASTVFNNGAGVLFECPAKAGYRLEIRESIVGYDDAPENIEGLIPDGCDAFGVEPRNSVLGDVVAANDFANAVANDFRLDIMGGDPYFIDDAGFAYCPPGIPKKTEFTAPCPPKIDARGNTRVGMPGWVGYDASSPAPRPKK